MNFNTKRILVIFSVALNIGFVVMAVILALNHPKRFRPSQEMRIEILSHLNLPEELEKSVIASMETVEASHKDFKRNLYQARNKGLTLLARPGPLDQAQFEQTNNEIVEIMALQNNSIRDHLVEIRQMLGDEKGARFFGEILEESRKHHPKNQMAP